MGIYCKCGEMATIFDRIRGDYCASCAEMVDLLQPVKQTKKILSFNRELMKLPEVLAIFPVSRTAWYNGIRKKIYPRPVSLGVRGIAWKRADVERLISTLKYKEMG